MKRMLLPILLASVLLTGCVKTKYTPLTSEQFIKAVERRDAVTQTVRSGDMFSSDHPEALIARVLFDNDTDGWSGVFWEFDGETAATACYSRLFEASSPSNSFTPGEEYDCIEVTMSEGAQPFLRVMRVHNTVLLVSSINSDESKKAVSRLLVSLGYN